jgi:hypothetical protein
MWIEIKLKSCILKYPKKKLLQRIGKTEATEKELKIAITSMDWQTMASDAQLVSGVLDNAAEEYQTWQKEVMDKKTVRKTVPRKAAKRRRRKRAVKKSATIKPGE